MSAPNRLGSLVLVLVPSEGIDDRDVVSTARMACCTAIREGLQPINPLLLYGMFLPHDELTGQPFKQKVMWWAKRASLIWVCFPIGRKVDLDPVTYDVLMGNETSGYVPRRRGDKSRIPIFSLTWAESDRYILIRMKKDELSELLRCNIVPGLLRGGLE